MPRSLTTHYLTTRPFGVGARFNGTNNYISLSAAPITDVSAFTITAWVKPASLSQNGIFYFNGIQRIGFGIGGISGENNGGRLRAVYENVAWLVSDCFFPNITSWYHVAMRRSGGVTHFFLNGVRYTPTNSTAVPSATTTTSLIGGSGSRYFNGEMDDLRIWTTALTDDQIKLEASGSSLYSIPSINPQAWWRFEEGSGSSVAESVAGIITGTWTGTLGSQWTNGPVLPGRDYMSQVLADAPVGYWRLDEASGNPADSSGNALTLTVGAGVGYRTSGLLLPFAGSSMKVPTGTITPIGTIADNVLLSILGNLTLECWVQRPNITTGTWVLISKGNLGGGAGSNLSYSLFIDGNNAISLRLSIDGIAVVAVSTAVNSILNTNIHHIVATYEQAKTRVRIYIDNILLKEVTNAPASIYNSDASFRIGAGATNADAATSAFTDGIMQEPAVYAKILEATRIDAHYRAGKLTRSLSAARSLVT